MYNKLGNSNKSTSRRILLKSSPEELVKEVQYNCTAHHSAHLFIIANKWPQPQRTDAATKNFSSR